MNINDLTIGQAKELASAFGGNNQSSIPFEVGKAYLFRTVTHVELGKVESICGAFVTLSTASWIADTGRYHDLLKSGVFDDNAEIEPYPNGTIVNTSALINAAPWPHSLPTEQK